MISHIFSRFTRTLSFDWAAHDFRWIAVKNILKIEKGSRYRSLLLLALGGRALMISIDLARVDGALSVTICLPAL